MFKTSLKGALIIAGMVLFASTAYGQSTNDATSNANVSSSQQTSSTNQGVNAVVNSYGATQLHESVNSQVPLSLVGYGSFSQNNCSNALGVGATTKIFSLVFNAPKPEINCQHMVRSDSFGREAGLANGMKKPMQAEIQRALSVWESCTADPQTTAACIRMGVIRYVDPTHPDLTQTMPNPHFTDEAIVMPKWNEPVSQVAQPAQATQVAVVGTIPHRPAGWTNAHLVKDRTQAAKPASDSQANTRSQAALNSLPWVQAASH